MRISTYNIFVMGSSIIEPDRGFKFLDFHIQVQICLKAQEWNESVLQC